MGNRGAMGSGWQVATIAVALASGCGTGASPSTPDANGESTAERAPAVDSPDLARPPTEVGGQAEEIIGGNTVGNGFLTGVVQVHSELDGDGTTCTAMVIGADTVLTAAHCVCTDDLVGTPDCASTAKVWFRPSPSDAAEPEMTGTVIVHPSYNPSWTEGLFDCDLAIVKLDGVAPAHALPYEIAQTFPTENQLVSVAGFGYNNGACDSGAGVLRVINARINEVESGFHPKESLEFEPQLICRGDSGGPVLDTGQTVLYGVNSTYWYSLGDGWVSNSTTTTQHFNWIKSAMCLSSPSNTCDGWGAPCNCTATNDVLWRQNTGATSIWHMTGGLIASSSSPGNRTADWKIAGSGDFDGDNNGDIVWRRDNGQFEIWRLTAAGSRLAPDYTSTWPSSSWTIQGIGDFDGNGRSDVLWRNTDGLAAIWFHGLEAGAVFLGYNNTPAAVSNQWQIRGVADFNGDGKSDILWWNAGTQQFAIWQMNGGTRIGEQNGVAPSQALIAGVGDFEGDLRSDILWRTSAGALAIDFDGRVSSRRSPSWRNFGGAVPNTWSMLGVADVDRDGRSDILWRESTGQVAVWIMEGARFVADLYPGQVDSSWSVATFVHAKN